MSQSWNTQQIREIHDLPLLDLVFKAAEVHRANQDHHEIQISSLLSIKTGGCTEDCAYCPQAARYSTGLDAEALMQLGDVVKKAEQAKASGASRFCMGAAWREVRDNSDFDRVLNMVEAVSDLGMEVCCTLGMLTEEQAAKLAASGLYAYNHNLDSSDDFYEEIISTRTYDDRLNTIKNVRKAKISVCSGGIIGMGETVDDRIKMLETLANLEVYPESVPINSLVPVEGTPLGEQERATAWELIRMVATARIIMPKTKVRLSAGRTELNIAEQALCFMAGANSIFAGDKLLTTPNPEFDEDLSMLKLLGLKPKMPNLSKKKQAQEAQ